MGTANLADSVANIAGLVAWATFAVLYTGYGNRLKAPAGRALVTMSLGYAVVLVVLLLHHPLGISALVSKEDAWFQAGAVAVSCAGTVLMTALMVRANGRWPWQRRKGGGGS
jgi:hypothetical protein